MTFNQGILIRRSFFGAVVVLALACSWIQAFSAEIKIGVAEALTGNAAQYGVPIRKGFELAVGEINGAGGINGGGPEG